MNCKIAMGNSLPQKNASQFPEMLAELLSKSFDAIKTLTPKVSSLYQFNQELEKSVSAMERKFTKIQRDNEDLQYNLRKRMLDIQMKVDCSVEEIAKMMEEVHWFKKQAESFVKMAKEKNVKESNKKIEGQQRIQRPIKTRKIMFQDEIKQKQKQERKFELKPKDHIKLDHIKRQSLLSCSELSLQLPNYEPTSRMNRRGQCSEKEISRKGNIKNNAACFNTARDIWDKNSNNSQKIDLFLKEMEDYQLKSQKIRNNYEKLLDQYNAQYVLKFQQFDQKLKEIEQKMKQIKPSDAAINIDAIIDQNEGQPQNESKKMNQEAEKIIEKLDKNIFYSFLDQLQDKLNDLRSQLKQVANRQQTKKAITFLESKINLLFEQNPCFSQQQKHGIKIKQVKMNIFPLSNPQKSTLCLKKYKRLSDNEGSTIRFSSSIHKKKKNNEQRQVKLMKSQGLFLNSQQIATSAQNKSNNRYSVIENESTLRPSFNLQMRDKHKKILKEKTLGILTAGSKTLGKLKKQRLVFQYD